MGRMNYFAMKTDEETAELLNSDFNELKIAAKKLINHMGGVGFGTSFLKWVASFAAMSLLVDLGSDKLENKYADVTSDPLYFLQFSLSPIQVPKAYLMTLSGEKLVNGLHSSQLYFGFSSHDIFQMPGSLILLLVVSPNLFAHTLRDNWIGVAICLAIGCYLLQEHIRASGGFRNSFTQSHGISNTMGIILLLVFPIWALVTRVV